MNENSTEGYSLIEVMIAAAVLMVAIAGAGAMALSVITQQETNAVIARAIGYQEQAARLYQIGLAPSTISAILPAEPALVSLTFQNLTTPALAGVGSMERAECVMVFRPSPATSSWSVGTWNPGDATKQVTNSLTVLRPVTR